MQPFPADTPLFQTHHSDEPTPCSLGRHRCTLATQARLSRHGRTQDEYSWRLGGEEGDGVGEAWNKVAHKAGFVHRGSKDHAKKKSIGCAWEDHQPRCTWHYGFMEHSLVSRKDVPPPTEMKRSIRIAPRWKVSKEKRQACLVR